MMKPKVLSRHAGNSVLAATLSLNDDHGWTTAGDGAIGSGGMRAHSNRPPLRKCGLFRTLYCAYCVLYSTYCRVPSYLAYLTFSLRAAIFFSFLRSRAACSKKWMDDVQARCKATQGHHIAYLGVQYLQYLLTVAYSQAPKSRDGLYRIPCLTPGFEKRGRRGRSARIGRTP